MHGVGHTLLLRCSHLFKQDQIRVLTHSPADDGDGVAGARERAGRVLEEAAPDEGHDCAVGCCETANQTHFLLCPPLLPERHPTESVLSKTAPCLCSR